MVTGVSPAAARRSRILGRASASVARELETHAVASRGRTAITIAAMASDRRQPPRGREVDTP